jgi:hypothetical protein
VACPAPSYDARTPDAAQCRQDAARSLAHLWGSRVQRLLLTVFQNCRYPTDLLRPLQFFEEDFVGLLNFLNKGFCDRLLDRLRVIVRLGC